jgi:(p)ppGpp synthase/HD superfamily hydrolase
MSTALGSRPARTSAARRFDAALVLATRAHHGQRREPGGAPYIEHVWEVSALLRLVRMPDDVVIAGLLHDSVERGDVQLEEIDARFGGRVGRAVAALTEDDGIDSYEARKAALRDQVATAGPEAAAVFAADKVSSARNIRRVVNERSDALEHMAPDLRHKFSHYEQSLGMLERIVPRLDLVRELRQELNALGSELRRHGILEA